MFKICSGPILKINNHEIKYLNIANYRDGETYREVINITVPDEELIKILEAENVKRGF